MAQFADTCNWNPAETSKSVIEFLMFRVPMVRGKVSEMWEFTKRSEKTREISFLITILCGKLQLFKILRSENGWR